MSLGPSLWRRTSEPHGCCDGSICLTVGFTLDGRRMRLPRPMGIFSQT